MSESASLLPVLTPDYTPSSVIQQIYDQLSHASDHEIVLEQSWIRLGRLLAQCKAAESWKDDFDSFEHFMEHLVKKYQRGRTQLWGYLTIAEKLEPLIPADVLEEIGVTKALAFRKALRSNNGKPLPDEIIQAARKRETTVKEVRALLARAYNLTPDDKGTWFDLDGFFLTPEEKKEFVDGVKTTVALLDIKKDVPDHIKRKEIIFAWLREFIGTHAAEINGVAPVNTPATLMMPIQVEHENSLD